MLGVSRNEMQRQTIGDRLSQSMKITVENLDLWTLVLRGVRNLAMKLYSNSS